MGQQQLFLVLLVFIIVGIAIIASMVLFKSEVLAFEESEYTQLVIETAELAQALYKKPTMLGGWGNSFEMFNFKNIDCPGDLEFNESTSYCENSEGTIRVGVLINTQTTATLILLINHTDGKTYERDFGIYAEDITTSEWTTW